MINYPVEGNFTATVRVNFEPNGGNTKVAGLGIHAVNENTSWIRVLYEPLEDLVHFQTPGNTIVRLNHSGPVIFIRMTRSGPTFTAEFSGNGENWVTILQDYVWTIPEPLAVYLTAYSTPNEGTLADFSDFSVQTR